MTDTPDPRAALADELTSFFNFINEPPAYEDQRMVRDYRHFLAHLWMPLHDKIVIALRSPSPYSGAAGEALRDNLREAWSALAMIRETVETLAPSGSVKAAEHLDGPTFMHEAEALVAGIVAIPHHPAP